MTQKQEICQCQTFTQAGLEQQFQHLNEKYRYLADMLQSLSILMYGVGYLRDFIVQFLKYIAIDADYIEYTTLPGF